VCSELLGITSFARSETNSEARSARSAGCGIQISRSTGIAFAAVAVSANDRVYFRTEVLVGLLTTNRRCVLADALGRRVEAVARIRFCFDSLPMG